MGQHEGVLIDPDGNIIRFGSPVEDGPTEPSPPSISHTGSWRPEFDAMMAGAPEADQRWAGGGEGGQVLASSSMGLMIPTGLPSGSSTMA